MTTLIKLQDSNFSLTNKMLLKLARFYITNVNGQRKEPSFEAIGQITLIQGASDKTRILLTSRF